MEGQESGKADEALARLDPKERYENCVNLYCCITEHRGHINYPEYEEKGYFCGSGTIESGRWEKNVVIFFMKYLANHMTK